MRVEIRGSEIEGRVSVPPSKSYTHRALLCSALARGTSRILSPLDSDDTEATKRILGELGVNLFEGRNLWQVEGGDLQRPSSDLFCGESGTTLRFMTAVCALVDGESKLTCGPSLSRRPIDPLLNGLRHLEVDCRSTNGLPPIIVHGKGRLRGGEATMRGDISSQFVSALLFIAPLTDEGVSLKITTSLESKPYVSMTMGIQREFGVKVHASDNMREYHVDKQSYRPTEFKVEGDWSSAAFPLAAGALAGQVTVEGLNMESLQADAAIVEVLKKMDAQVELRKDFVSVSKSSLMGVEVDVSDCPDIFPVIVALSAAAEGRSVINGIERLKYKESDRAEAMVEGLRNMGIKTVLHEDRLEIMGGKPRGGVVNPKKDHRIAMALAILGLVAEEETTILDAECVSKSYANFWREMEALGANLRRIGDEQ
jgi:3-phosphoshikimate 1-carboxyvinyltransferase